MSGGKIRLPVRVGLFRAYYYYEYDEYSFFRTLLLWPFYYKLRSYFVLQYSSKIVFWCVRLQQAQQESLAYTLTAAGTIHRFFSRTLAVCPLYRRMTRDGTAKAVSRDHLRRERGQGNMHFPCSADHVQDWQPYPVDPSSCYMCDHTYIVL